jgi:predicted RNase H-like nuclease (RuvC/YqgF family)
MCGRLQAENRKAGSHIAALRLRAREYKAQLSACKREVHQSKKTMHAYEMLASRNLPCQAAENLPEATRSVEMQPDMQLIRKISKMEAEVRTRFPDIGRTY